MANKTNATSQNKSSRPAPPLEAGAGSFPSSFFRRSFCISVMLFLLLKLSVEVALVLDFKLMLSSQSDFAGLHARLVVPVHDHENARHKKQCGKRRKGQPAAHCTV